MESFQMRNFTANIVRCVAVTAAALAFVNVRAASDVPQEEHAEAEVHFRQGHAVINADYKENGAHLDSLAATMTRLSGEDRLTGVHVVGGASPEGSTAINQRLSQRRAAAIYDYMSTLTTLPDSLTSFTILGRDWQGLRSLVESDVNMPDRDAVLSILNDIPAEPTPAQSDRALARIKATGNAYAYMYDKLFAPLRESRIYIDYLMPVQSCGVARADIGLPLTTAAIGGVLAPLPVYKPQPKPFYMALKTNMLFDALALPNIGAEFYVGKNWSVGADWMYGWWDKDSRHRYWRAYGGDITVRRWFGRAADAKPLTGHHLGLYAGIVTYDFEFGGKGYMGGIPGGTLWDRCQYGGGIEYGYSLPVGRRLNIDFTIGIGYLGGKLVEYKPDRNFYVWEKTKHLNWFGPTKLEVSLVWLIGRGNVNTKGGEL